MGRVITFAQQKGGAGKTTLLVHLAHSWLLAGRKVAVIDIDPQKSLSRWLAYGSLPGLGEIESKDYRASSDIRHAARDFDLVLVDCPGNASSLLEGAIRTSELIIVPCQATAMDVWATEAILKMAKAENVKSVVVMNRVPVRPEATDNAVNALTKSGATVLETRIGNRVAYSSGFPDGKTALDNPRKSVAKAEIEALREEIDNLQTQHKRGIFGR